MRKISFFFPFLHAGSVHSSIEAILSAARGSYVMPPPEGVHHSSQAGMPKEPLPTMMKHDALPNMMQHDPLPHMMQNDHFPHMMQHDAL